MKKKSWKSTIILWVVLFAAMAYLATKFAMAFYTNISIAQFVENFNTTIRNPFDLKIQEHTGTFILVAAIVWLIMLASYFISHGKYMHGKEHGSGEWGNAEQIAKSITQKHNISLSENVKIGLDFKKHKRNLNVLVIGGAGTGKTRGFVYPNILDFEGNYAITDPKGEIYKKLAGLLKEQGYEVKVLNTKDMKNSNRYNPLKYINLNLENNSQEDLRGIPKLVSILIKNTKKNKNSTGDDFWENAEILLLQAFLYYIVEELPTNERNFNTLMRMLAEMKTDNKVADKIDLLFKELEEENPNSLGVRQYKMYKNAGEKTAQSIIISLGARLAMFSDFAFRELIGKDELDLKEFGNPNKKIVLFCIIPDNEETYNFLVGMLYSQLFDVLYALADKNATNELPKHTRFIMDEWANIALPADFLKVLATCRSRNISIDIILQDISQLKVAFEKGWEQIIGNCSSFLFLGGNEYSMFEYISKLLGKTTIKTQTHQKSWQSTTTNINITGRELMTPDEVKCMKYDECIVFIQNELPILDSKCVLEKHSNYHLFKKALPMAFMDLQEEQMKKLEQMATPTKEEIFAVFGKGELTIDEKREKEVMEQINLYYDSSGILDLTSFGDLADENNLNKLTELVGETY